MSKSLKPSNFGNLIDRFKETARPRDADEGDAAFDEKLKEIAKQRQHSGNPKKKP